MLQNPNSQFQIPTSDPNSDLQVNDVLSDVYKTYSSQIKSYESPVYLQSKTEKEKSLSISRLNAIGNNIEMARSNRLKMQPSRHSRNMKIFVNDISELFFKRSMSNDSYESLARNELISRESAIGASVFGLKTDDLERNEFFYDGRDEKGIHSWFFHQEKTVDTAGNHSSRTLHYEVLPTGVLLVGTGYLQGEELGKFTTATEMYHERVMNQIYSNNNESLDSSNRSNRTIGKVISFFNKNDGHDNGRLAA